MHNLSKLHYLFDTYYFVNIIKCWKIYSTSSAKTHLWRTVGQPVLTYGQEAIYLSKGDTDALDRCQSSLMKSSLGLRQRSHHSDLLTALGVQRVSDAVKENSSRLLARIMMNNSPAWTLNIALLSRFIVHGYTVHGTLLQRTLLQGISPIALLLGESSHRPLRATQWNPPPEPDGVVHSLKFLLHHENFVKPWSAEHLLTELLTKCF